MKNETFFTGKNVVLFISVLWFIFMVSIFMWNYFNNKNQIKQLAKKEAETSFNKDLLFREWGAMHGGVYVPVTEETKPNPYLDVYERDIETPKGQKLTLMNPAYMTRQIYELAKKKYFIQGHITSLKPINPGNKPDKWEIQVLKLFEKGSKEYYEFVESNGNQSLRFMRPFITQQVCLKCHAKQGYKVGDIRGGISITVPMTKYLILLKKNIYLLFGTYFIVWLLGIVAILIIVNKKIKHNKEKKELSEKLNQAHKMEAVGTLAGGVAHDFNNLLTVINGYAEMALNNMDKGNPLHKNLTSILTAGNRAKNITGQLLAFSRKQVYNPEILNINEVISSLNNMLYRLIGEDIKVETVFEENLPSIKADKSQLEQIFINLIINARDALRAIKKPDYHKKITIETGQVYLDKEYVAKHQGSIEGRHIFFAVSDNGIGMDEKTKQKVFEPFFTTKEKYKGTGLGLSMIYGIVKQNNSSIYVYSEPREGSMFKIYWLATEEKSNVKNNEVETNLLHGNENILIVEDEREVCLFASKALTSLGYKVLKAENGRVAIDLIKSKKPAFDLIITDLVMPELNGKEFIEKVMKFHPAVKVIYVSGYTDNHIVHNGLLEEDVNFVHKPYSVKILAATVRKVLDEV